MITKDQTKLQVLGTKKKKNNNNNSSKRQFMVSSLLQVCLLESWWARWLLLPRMSDPYPWGLPWQEWGELLKPTLCSENPPLPWKNPWACPRAWSFQERPPWRLISPYQLSRLALPLLEDCWNEEGPWMKPLQ